MHAPHYYICQCAHAHQDIGGGDESDGAVGAGHEVGSDTQRPGPPVIPDDGAVPDRVPAHTPTFSHARIHTFTRARTRVHACTNILFSLCA